MGNTSALVLDLALVLIMGILVYDCYRKGLVSALIKLIGTVAGFLLAALLSRPVSQWVYDTFLEERMEEMVAQQLPQGLEGFTGGAAADIAQLQGTVEQTLEHLGEKLDLSFFTGVDLDGIAQGALELLHGGAGLVQAITQTALEPAVVTILSMGLFFLVYIAVMFIARVAVIAGLGVNHIPLVGGINHLGGAALGVVYAAALGYVLSLALGLIAGVSGGSIPILTTAVLEDTWLISRFLSIKLG